MTNINCIICSEIFTQNDEVVVTRCGHLFHRACLSPWLQRAQTCPQCRTNCTDATLQRVYFNIDDDDTASVSPTRIDNGTVNELLDGANIQALETERNLSKADEDIRVLTQINQELTENIDVLKENLLEKDGAVLSYVEEVTRLKEEMANLHVKVSSIENALETCESQKTDLSNVIVTLQGDLSRETERTKIKEERVAQLESESSIIAPEQGKVLCEEISALKNKLKVFEQIKVILSNRLEKVHDDLCKETQLRKNSEERLGQLETKLVKAAIERDISQTAQSSQNPLMDRNVANQSNDTKLLFQAKDKARITGWKFVWEKDGKILARKEDRSKVLHIANDKDLNKMV